MTCSFSRFNMFDPVQKSKFFVFFVDFFDTQWLFRMYTRVQVNNFQKVPFLYHFKHKKNWTHENSIWQYSGIDKSQKIQNNAINHFWNSETVMFYLKRKSHLIKDCVIIRLSQTIVLSSQTENWDTNFSHHLCRKP